MITYMVESWPAVWQEMKPLWLTHWEEVALHQGAVPLDPDEDEYARMDAVGMLSLVIARKDGVLIGYYASIIKPHLHYRTTLHAFTDVYYVLPKYRNGWCGIRLFQHAEKVWRARGVKKAFTATKLHLDMGAILRRLDWEPAENTFCKLLTE